MEQPQVLMKPGSQLTSALNRNKFTGKQSTPPPLLPAFKVWKSFCFIHHLHLAQAPVQHCMKEMWRGKVYFSPFKANSVNHQKGPLEQSASINFVVDCSYHIKSKLRCCYLAQFMVKRNKQLLQCVVGRSQPNEEDDQCLWQL